MQDFSQITTEYRHKYMHTVHQPHICVFLLIHFDCIYRQIHLYSKQPRNRLILFKKNNRLLAFLTRIAPQIGCVRGVVRQDVARLMKQFKSLFV